MAPALAPLMLLGRLLEGGGSFAPTNVLVVELRLRTFNTLVAGHSYPPQTRVGCTGSSGSD